MIEEITYDELTGKQTWLSSFVLNCREIRDVAPLRDSAPTNDAGEPVVAVELFMNGKPVSFRQIVERLANCYEEDVKRSAASMVDQKTNDVYGCLNECREMVDNLRQEIISIVSRRLGVNLEDD